LIGIISLFSSGSALRQPASLGFLVWRYKDWHDHLAGCQSRKAAEYLLRDAAFKMPHRVGELENRVD
jgi:hypothetical protein